MSVSKDFEMMKIVGAVHDQIASDEEIAELDEWLRDDPRAQRLYLEFVDMQHEIERQIAGVSTTPRLIDQHRSSTNRGWPSRIRTIALAASILVIVGMGYMFRSIQQDGSVTQGHGNSAKTIVGIVTAIDDALGYCGRRKLDSGSALSAGVVSLESGKMQLRLESGVGLFLAGPAKLDLTDPRQVTLLSGTVTADVPESVIGFSVKVPGLNVVDLGTTFGVSLPPGGQPHVHVFEGVVDAEVDGRQEPTRLTDHQTMSFDGMKLAEIGFDESLFAKPMTATLFQPETTGDVRFLHTRPSSVERGKFEHGFVLCFRERDQPTLLPANLPVSFDVPGHYRVKPKWKNFGELRKGTLVDSYFIHLDVVGPEKRLREGAVTFDRPILGVVFSSQLLADQVELLGSPGTSYSQGGTNPRNDATLENETVTLSADRRTIRFSWYIRSRTDQVRVLVAAENETATNNVVNSRL